MTIQNQTKRLLPIISLVFSFLLLAAVAIAADQFVLAGDGTVKDNFTGLTWIQNPSAIPELAGQRTYLEAEDACTQLVFAGLGPNVWRLPTINELKSIYNSRFKNPRVNTGFFSADGGAYWSRTPYLPGTKAWTLNYKTGFLGGFDRNNPQKPARQYTRCVTKV